MSTITTLPPRIDRGAYSWALFEWARNPWVLLCVIYVFAPYVTNHILGGGAHGQAVFSGWQKLSGLLVAATAPFLGAAADRMGHRKPLIFVAMMIMAPIVFAQWWVTPTTPLWVVEFTVIAAALAYAWTEVLHNSMITSVTSPALVSRVSGLGLALGALSSVLLLVFVLFAFALPGVLDLPGIPREPMFGLNRETFEPERISAPICAVWLVAFSLPFFLFTPDRNPSGEPILQAFRDGVSGVAKTLSRLMHDYQNVARFLLARMLYVDGTTALIVFGGIYSSGVFHWGLVQLLAYGVSLSIFSVLGGFVGAWFDHWVGSKNATLIAVAVTLVCLIVEVSMSPTEMFFVIPVDPAARVWNGIAFQTAPEIGFLCASLVIAIAVTGTYGSSRALMAHLCPPGMEGELFGLYALSSSATAWLGPTLVEFFTNAYDSQRAGFGSISILLVIGLLLLLTVKPPPKHA